MNLPTEYIGNDNRKLQEIIDTDLEFLKSLNIPIELLVNKMIEIRDKALKRLEGEVKITDFLIAFAYQARGCISCPLCGKSLSKTNITVTHIHKNRSLVFSEMNIHLIQEHSFFEGKGAAFRLEPVELVELLFNK